MDTSTASSQWGQALCLPAYIITWWISLSLIEGEGGRVKNNIKSGFIICDLYIFFLLTKLLPVSSFTTWQSYNNYRLVCSSLCVNFTQMGLSGWWINFLGWFPSQLHRGAAVKHDRCLASYWWFMAETLNSLYHPASENKTNSTFDPESDGHALNDELSTIETGLLLYRMSCFLIILYTSACFLLLLPLIILFLNILLLVLGFFQIEGLKMEGTHFKALWDTNLNTQDLTRCTYYASVLQACYCRIALLTLNSHFILTCYIWVTLYHSICWGAIWE